MSRRSLAVGDVFTIPINSSRVGLGQVAATYLKDAYYFAVFDVEASPDEIDIDDAIARPVILLALSFDAKVAAGDWTVVGRRPVRDDIPLPAVKEMVGGPKRVDVVDFSGTRRRAASDAEQEFLSYRNIVAPVRLEKALRAK